MKDIIISITTYPQRLDMAIDRINEMMNQDVPIKAVELNLSEEEFPMVPDKLNELCSQYNNLHINLLEGNTRVFKKLLPTVKKYLHQDVLIATIDDDISYSPGYIHNLVVAFMNSCADKFTMADVPDNGSREMYNCLAFDSDVFEYLTDDIIKTQLDDIFYRLYIEKKGKICKYNKGKADELMKPIDNDTNKLSDVYAPGGNIDWEYVNNAIKTIKKGLGL